MVTSSRAMSMKSSYIVVHTPELRNNNTIYFNIAFFVWNLHKI